MSYSDANRKTYAFGPIDFGAGTVTLGIARPARKLGRVVSIDVAATEAFTADTTEGAVQIGKTGDLDAYAAMGLGTLAAGAGASSDQDANAGAIVADTNIDADVVVTCVAPTGGVPAGIGHVTVVIDWDW